VYATKSWTNDAFPTVAKAALGKQVVDASAANRAHAGDRGCGGDASLPGGLLVSRRLLPLEAMTTTWLPITTVSVLAADHGVATVHLLDRTFTFWAKPAILCLPLLILLQFRMPCHRLSQSALLRRGLPHRSFLQAQVGFAATL
jgi:hypothetical protein